MIEIKDLTKRFNDKILFENFNLKVEDKEFVIISGNSGCGKTTLLNMIGGIEDVDNGKILVDGIDISKKKNKLTYFRTKVGFLFQNFALIENKTVKDNLNLIYKNSRTDLTIKECLTAVGLEDKINSKVYTLSGGEQQRVALARLMLKKCTLILADEPTGSLDKGNSEIVMRILKKINSMGKTVILVTHNDEIKEQGDKIVNL